MNVLYTSRKLQELFKDDKIALHSHASGDGDVIPGRCCRLCGGDTSLRYFGDTYVWEGIEERYDHLLYDCFGVKVSPSDCMICEWCVRALRSTERFRALVHAAFDQSPSDISSSATTLKSEFCMQPDIKLSPKQEKDINKKPFDSAKRREARKRFGANEAKSKRINIPCEVCRQRYPMLVPNDGYKTFICSRCKKNGELKGSVCRKCNIVMPASMMKEHLELHAKADLRAKSRSRQPKKSPVPFANTFIKPHRPQKFQCSRCPKKYAVARNLAIHVRNAHGDSIDNLCSVCGQYLESRERLEEHLAEHSGLHQCDECLLIFKNKRSLVSHSLTHHIKCSSS
ncbi:zinc finger protein 569-like [Trichoplusia ni]|uniref:Zinc finger protein 569-like n=1 Tax=Trichoplusia ni TaxID=7111 RepID=A0A7E5WTK4_TRINI|nr:zinc finger protein 569-like [Trichoplusia ni]